MRTSKDEIEIDPILAIVARDLPLQTIALTDDYFYQSLPLCVIDVVYSIGVRYEGVRRVVARYCDTTQQRRGAAESFSVAAADGAGIGYKIL